MTKAEFVKHVKSNLDGSRRVEDVVDQVFASLAELTLQGESISIRGFGKFEAPLKEAYEARNPRTGEPIQVPARRRLRLKASSTFGKE